MVDTIGAKHLTLNLAKVRVYSYGQFSRQRVEFKGYGDFES